MKNLFLHFNTDGTIRSASLRADGKKLPDTAIWELFELYQLLIKSGYKAVTLPYPDGSTVDMITY